jgi:hypothetical protein
MPQRTVVSLVTGVLSVAAPLGAAPVAVVSVALGVPLIEPVSEPVPPVVVSFFGALQAASVNAARPPNSNVDTRFMVAS